MESSPDSISTVKRVEETTAPECFQRLNILPQQRTTGLKNERGISSDRVSYFAEKCLNCASESPSWIKFDDQSHFC